MERFRNTYYIVTSCGKVWSENSRKFLSPSVNNKDGYMRVMLTVDGVRHMFLLHRVIAECYVDNPDNLPIVNHKDGIKSHCWTGNLEWSTTSDNNKHAIDNELHRRLSDGLNGMSKPIDCYEDGAWITYQSSATLARKLGVNRASITRVLKGERPTICGYKVRYVNNN